MLSPFTHFACLGLLSALLTRPSFAAPTSNDPCVKIAGHAFVDSADALACLKSFPFSETLRQNVLSVVSRVFDFYTFEIFYSEYPPPSFSRIDNRHTCTDPGYQLYAIRGKRFPYLLKVAPTYGLPRPTMTLI